MSKRKTAIITGITGQDGSYLAELLLSKGYSVHGIKRRASIIKTDRVDHLFHDPHENSQRFALHYGDVTDSTNVMRLIAEIEPDEIYNLAAQSHVMVSFETPEYTANSDALGPLRMLEAIRVLGLKQTRFYQASTSELFGGIGPIPQNEQTPFYPRSPYGAAKLYAHWITVNYREAYSIYAANGILFNHESPRRGETFVTRKITMAVARIRYGLQNRVYLGNLEAKRDWGHARDYVDGMWRILQQPKPDDYVLATGVTTTVREFVRLAFSKIGVDVEFTGEGVNEIGRVVSHEADIVGLNDRDTVVEIDPRYFRPTEVDVLCGDSSKAERLLGWKARTSVDELVDEMVKSDIQAVAGSLDKRAVT